ncbi:GNAT family N-acetyltransferase [Nafulsella turpanensis]|uniref:GNAT family N-acetyltransferase n=1 Tax=Nafulsella turpanensis TaxID=1265690 RepID=UPI000345F113|nr:GNAT family N-acetyltransferase [Nafulsella turpanensis]
MTEIIPASEADIPAIREIAEKTWWPAYNEILEAGQIRYMLDTLYAKENIRAQLKSGGQSYLLLLEDGYPTGFASFAPREDKPEVYKLHKLYCLPETQGKGFGKMLVQAVSARARKAGAQFLELNVNRYNKARKFYEKVGFRVAYEEDIPIGPYWMNDYVMRMPL